MAEAPKRYAVVTGANKGIGFEVCRQLARTGIMAILTSRDEQRGLAAVRKLENSGLSGLVAFHRLDVTRQDSVASLAEFVRTHFGKLDILVNNAGVSGTVFHADAHAHLAAMGYGKRGVMPAFEGITKETWELAEECLKTNYHGTKMMVREFVDLLQLSDSPRIVNNSSNWGRLENIPNKWAREVLADVKNLGEETVDEVVEEFLSDFRQGSLKMKGWPTTLSAYIMSKTALNAYTFVTANKYPSIMVNSVCPGYVKTNMALNLGNLSAEEGAEAIVRMTLLPKGGPSGCFFRRKGRDPILHLVRWSLSTKNTQVNVQNLL